MPGSRRVAAIGARRVNRSVKIRYAGGVRDSSLQDFIAPKLKVTMR